MRLFLAAHLIPALIDAALFFRPLCKPGVDWLCWRLWDAAWRVGPKEIH